MIVRHFNIVLIARVKTEADMPLVIDPDVPLVTPVVFEPFQAVRGWQGQIARTGHRVQQPQLVERALRDSR